MFRPSRMVKLDILVLEQDAQAVTEELGNLQVIHLTDAKDSPEALPVGPVEKDEIRREVMELQSRCEKLYTELGVTSEPGDIDDNTLTLPVMRAGLTKIERQTADVTGPRRELTEESQNLESSLREASPYRDVDVSIEQMNSFSYLYFTIGTVIKRNIPLLRQEAPRNTLILELPSEVPEEPDRQMIVAICPRTGRWALQTILGNAGFQSDVAMQGHKDSPRHIIESTEKRLARVKAELASMEAERMRLADVHGAVLAAYRRRLAVEAQILGVEQNYGKTGSTYLISGWIPHERVGETVEAIKTLTGNRAVVEVNSYDKAGFRPPHVPVMLRNHRLLKPFEILVTGYSTPTYDELEPTPLVALTFLLMFGYMFSDVGHGLAVFLIGLLLRKKAADAKIRDMGYVVASAGVSATFFGALKGEFFGWELPFWEPLMKSPAEHVMTYLVLAIGLGVVLISAGLVMNIINRLLIRDYAGALLDKFGLAGALFYWLALALVAVSASGRTVRSWHVGLLAVPLAVMFLKEPIHNLATGKKVFFEEGLLSVFTELIDLVEVSITFLANTVSFARILGFMLAHTFLCGVMVLLIEMTIRMPAGLALAVIVGVVGHAVIIGLEGLVVSIQCMRLQYYEFFSKFFKGGGLAYRPFRLT